MTDTRDRQWRHENYRSSISCQENFELPKMFMFRYYLNNINLLKIISIAIKYITPDVFLKSNTFIIIFILYIYMHPSNKLTTYTSGGAYRLVLNLTSPPYHVYSYNFACLPYLMRNIIHETNFQDMKMFPFYNSRFWFRLWLTYSIAPAWAILIYAMSHYESLWATMSHHEPL